MGEKSYLEIIELRTGTEANLLLRGVGQSNGEYGHYKQRSARGELNINAETTDPLHAEDGHAE